MQVTFSLFVFQFTLRIKKEFLVFPLTHHATASSDHNIPFYPIQKLRFLNLNSIFLNVGYNFKTVSRLLHQVCRFSYSVDLVTY